ncbi:MAG: hypothetical protein J6328_01765 [Bacilli bacterium]|nr:hypothetical protein [Bacilli bacterium]
MARVKEKQKTFPKNIKAGRIMLLIACVMFFFDAAYQLTEMISLLSESKVIWTNALSVMSFLKLPFLSLFFVLGGLSGLGFLKDKGVLAGWVGLIAILCFFFFSYDVFDSIVKLIKTSDWGRFAGSFISVQVDTTLYFIGWFISKDYFDD